MSIAGVNPETHITFHLTNNDTRTYFAVDETYDQFFLFDLGRVGGLVLSAVFAVVWTTAMAGKYAIFRSLQQTKMAERPINLLILVDQTINTVTRQELHVKSQIYWQIQSYDTTISCGYNKIQTFRQKKQDIISASVCGADKPQRNSNEKPVDLVSTRNKRSTGFSLNFSLKQRNSIAALQPKRLTWENRYSPVKKDQ